MPSPILLSIQRPQVCTVCGHKEDGQLYRNCHLLGFTDALCTLCFQSWYDGGLTDRDEIKAYAKLKRGQQPNSVEQIT